MATSSANAFSNTGQSSAEKRDPAQSTSTRWNDGLLTQARQEGDPTVDALAEGIIRDVPFDHATGRLGYQQLLGVADLLLLAPELTLLKESSATIALERMPAKYVDYFDPQLAPEWVDEKKLARAGEIWNKNMLAIIGVLYASSLPSCYLIGNGIPALYQSGKLGQHRFIYQRIYETGIMLDAVMEPGGLSVFRDLPVSADQPGKRYIWGRGYVAAKKVRMLHASMRVLLTKPHVLQGAMAAGDQAKFSATSIGAMTVAARPDSATAGKPPMVIYDVGKLGQPINQEDLAFTLLTFGLAIPEGLRAWGCHLSDDDCEAFLHTWLLVGHIMGIRDDLLPDDYASAKDLFQMIKKRQVFGTDMGKKLTKSLEFFLAEYLPKRMRPDVPMMLIETLLPPENVDMIRPKDSAKPTTGNRLLLKSAFFFVRLYYAFKAFIVTHIPVAGQVLGSSFAIAGDALIDSWRDGYDRRPFYIPDSATGGWRREPGMNQEVRRALREWRVELFGTVFKGLAFLIGGTLLAAFIMAAAVVWGFWETQQLLSLSLIGIAAGVLVCGGGWIISSYILTARVLAVVKRRPGPKEPSIDVPPTA
jgi:ER-bound oxygenase mpaB/B'/Rubber oxygenase, catalytic domain